MTTPSERTTGERTTGEGWSGRRALVVIVLALAAGLLTAILVGAEPAGPNDTLSSTYGVPDLPRDLAAHQWLLDQARSSPATRTTNRVTLVFGPHGISGDGPCNAYHASVSIDTLRDTIQVTNLGHTMKACDPSTEKSEREYFAALQAVRHIHLNGRADHLVLDNATGDHLSYFAQGSRVLFPGF